MKRTGQVPKKKTKIATVKKAKKSKRATARRRKQSVPGVVSRGRRGKRIPTPPGELLREEFLHPLGFTQKQLADHLGCDVKVINRLVNGRTSLDAVMALRLAAAFGTTPEFWLNAQKATDLYRARKRVRRLPKLVSGSAPAPR